jgi:succinoglycan biosynthesis transport protein ExoP
MNAAALQAQEFRAKRDYRIAGTEGEEAEKGRAATRQNTIEELDSTAQTYRRIYESYLMAYTESVQTQSYPITNARIITEATRPLGKSHPKTKLILAFGALLGSFAGLGIAFVRHSIDRSIWNPRQIREEAGLECLASIPTLAEPRASAFSQLIFGTAAMGGMLKAVANKPSYSLDSGRKTLLRAAVSIAATAVGGKKPPIDKHREGMMDAVVTMPFSAFCHGIKTLKTAIALAGRTRQIRCLALTSALPNEGKTTICANLATLFAISGVRTLLIDGDLRNAALTRALAPEADYGLIDAISGTANPADCIVRANEAGVDPMPAIGTAHPTKPAYRLGTVRPRQLLHELQSAYAYVIR